MNDDGQNVRPPGEPFTERAFDSFSLRGAERFTMTEAAKLKGVSYHTVSRAVRQGRLPVLRLGRMALIAGEDLENWQPMRERAPRRYRQAPATSDVLSPVVLDEALGERLQIARQLSTVFEVIHAASSKLTMSEFGALLASRFSTIFGLTRVSLWTIDRQDRSAERIATIGPDISLTPDKIDISRGYAKLFSFVELGKARVSLDPRTEFADAGAPEVALASGPILIVPLRVRDRTIGGIFGDREGDRLTLDEDQLSLAQVLGNQAALALDNAMLLKEEQLRNTQLSIILDQMSDLVRACDTKGRLNLINRADRRFDSGKGADLAIGSNAFENPHVLERRELDGALIGPDRHPLARALRGESVTDWEYQVTRVDGRVQLAQVSARPLYVDGEITGAVYIGRNVTALREAEARDRERIARIERASERAQALADMAMRIHTAPNAQHAVQVALDCLAHQLGERRGLALMIQGDGGLGVSATSRVPSDLNLPAIRDPISISTTIMALARNAPIAVRRKDAGRAEQNMMSLLDASALIVAPLQINDEHLGAMLIFHNETEPIDDEDLTFASAVGRQCAHAIDRIRLDEELEAIRARLLGVIDQFPQAALIVDAADGMVSTANAAVASLWGTSLEPGRVRADALRILDPEGQPYASDEHPLLRSIRTGARSIDELLTLERDDGSQVEVLGRHTPITGTDGAVVGSVSVLQNRAPMQQDTQSNVRFITHVVDELVGPVAALRLELHRMHGRLSHRNPGAPEAGELGVIANGLDRASGKVERLLNVSRAEAGELEIHPAETDASLIIQAVVDSVTLTSPERLVRVAAPHSIPVVWDEARVQQLLCDALDNAVRYAPSGPIDVDGRVLDGDIVQIVVSDEGPGIPMGLRNLLGTQTYPLEAQAKSRTNAKRQDHGLGVGLYIAAHLARAHGGSLTVGDRPGGGTAVTLTLPRVAIAKA